MLLFHFSTHVVRGLRSQDGPLYRPMVGILSLEGPAMLQFWRSVKDAREADLVAQGDTDGEQRTRSEPVASVLCMPRSLLIFT